MAYDALKSKLSEIQSAIGAAISMCGSEEGESSDEELQEAGKKPAASDDASSNSMGKEAMKKHLVKKYLSR